MSFSPPCLFCHPRPLFKKKYLYWFVWGEEKDMVPSAATRNIFAWLHMPFSFERVLSLIQNIELYMIQLSARTEEKRDYVFIKSEYKLIKINLSDILYLSGLRDYTQVFFKRESIAPYHAAEFERF
jgi:DNA-binding LytR/AlgR family response regulator